MTLRHLYQHEMWSNLHTLSSMGVSLFSILWPYLGAKRTDHHPDGATANWLWGSMSLYFFQWWLGQPDISYLLAHGVWAAPIQSQNQNSCIQMQPDEFPTPRSLKMPPMFVQDFDSKVCLLGGTPWNKGSFLYYRSCLLGMHRYQWCPSCPLDEQTNTWNWRNLKKFSPVFIDKNKRVALILSDQR